MGEKLIKPYEISVWEEQLTQIEGSNPAEYKFKEQKLAIIGSDTMTGPNKVYDPVFTKKVNGEKILTFSLKYKYFDPYSENEDVINPFAALLVNERKIKLHYEGKWYEFIIKEHSESSDELIWTYTCSDAFVLELSKNGYNIEFNSDLNNNLGTARELAEKTLENTEWQVKDVDSLKQYIEDPIYNAKLVDISGINIINANNGSAAELQANTDIYLFFNYVKNRNGKFVQFITKRNTADYTIDDKNVITDTNYRIIDELVYEVREVNDETIKGFWQVNNGNYQLVISIGEIERLYQANRLDYSQKTTYDPIMERTVQRYKVGDREVYKYDENLYTTSNVVQNFIVNGDNFNVLEDGTLQGWNPYVDSEDNESIQKMELITYPELEYGKKLVDLEKLSTIDGYLKVKFIGPLTNDYLNTIYNDGFESNLSSIGPIAKGDEFLFRWRAGSGELDSLQSVQSLGLLIAKYTRDTPQRWGRYYYHIDTNDIILNINGLPKILNNIIEGGELSEDYKSYIIDNVVQTPSTKYLYKSGDNYYYWNGIEGIFTLHSSIVNGEEVIDSNSTFLPYYYLSAKAEKALTQAVLDDSTINYGIFIYSTDSSIDQDNPIYFKDVQFTRCIYDANKKPVILGNIPTATVSTIEHYYFKPLDGQAAEDIETYSSIEELETIAGNTAIPLYNEDSEKNLSISVSQSNCFDILQTIAETFECWIDLVVEHDEQGYITYSEGNPNKFVYLREYAGKDNYTGFKYGINLQSIERTIDSNEIVTKLIVDQSQSEYVDEGYIAISNAPSNPSGEEYILNFDYYYNQGLLNREIVEADRKQFIEEVAAFNVTLRNLEEQRRNLETAITTLGSKRNVFTELIDSAQDAQIEAIEDFEYLTDSTYEDYKNWYNQLVDNDTLPEDEDEINSLFDEENVLSVLGQLYASSATINNYTGILSNINTEYWDKRKLLKGTENHIVKIWTGEDSNTQTHLFVELDDYWQGVSFTIPLDNYEVQTYEFTISNKYFDIPIYNEATQWELTFTIPEGYTIESNPCIIHKGDVVQNKILSGVEIIGIEKEIDEVLKQKKDYINNFNNKYIRYIVEGTWNSTDYIDSELYYLDALQVSNTSAQPAISYTINVVEISQLEGLEDYNFDAGDKTYVEDTEFFGWTNKNGILTPAREEVIVSEVEWHLEEPENNVITVQNYKTRFEDLFQRVSAAVQTVQYNEATYAKMSSLMDANGTINADVLVQSLQQVAGRQYDLTSDGSVLIDQDRILVRNLNNTQNLVIINSEGLRISSDGGSTWTTAIDGRGINIGTVYTGKLNTDQIVIGSETNPSFRWDKSGISAYKSEEDEAYDLKTFVRYDQYGLYGIKDNNTFKANSLQDVKDNAHFAVTWDGFFIKNSYEGGGRVEITSDNDFRVLNDPTNHGNFQEKIKIGALEWGDGITSPDAEGATALPTLYGIRIKNDAGAEVMKTDDDGNITISGTINANAGIFDGLVRVGTGTPHINIDGINSLIGTSNYQDGAGYGWMINADGDAVFNNITARGAIKTAVFEYAEIQAVGGVFIFRPSSTIRSATINGNDLILTVEKPILFKEGNWCKISNYTAGGEADDPDVDIDNEQESAQSIIQNNGLSHVYPISNIITSDGFTYITLSGAAGMIGNDNIISDVEQLIGGALVDMGNSTGTSNYGIGINSSDNSVNLPARAISLFETEIDNSKSIKVSYKYRGILGTLPHMTTEVDSSIYQNMEGTQGIYTDNMYIGDNNQYIVFYEDANGNKQLKIKANQIVYEVVDEETGETDWQDITDIEAEGVPGPQGPAGQDAIRVEIDPIGGNFIKRGQMGTSLIAHVYEGINDITNQFNHFTWYRRKADGTRDTSWSTQETSNQLSITTADVDESAVFVCEVTVTR